MAVVKHCDNLLNGGYTGHLARGLQCTAKEQPTERRAIVKQLDIRLRLVLMFERDALLNLSKFGLDPSVVFVTMRMQLGQGAQSLFASVVVDEPARRLDKS